MQVQTVDLILQKTLGVFETIQDRIQGCVNEIVHVLGAHPGNFRLWSELGRDDPDYPAPLLIELDVFADRRGRAEDTVFRSRAEDAHGSRRFIFRAVEETAFSDAQMADLQITWLHAVNDRSILLRFGEKLSGSEPFAGRAILDIQNILSNDLIIAERQTWRVFPHFLQFLPIVGFLGFHDEVANAKLFDEGHDFLLRSRSDREHCYDRSYAKNHAQHGQQGPQLVAGQVFEPEDQIRQPLLQGSWLGDGAGLHGYAPGFTWNLDPGWESSFHRSCCCRRSFSRDSPERRQYQAAGR